MTPAAIKTILVVDDDREVLTMAEDMLTTMGYTVIGTIDPGAALHHARMPGAIDLLLSDVAMPLMDGAQLAREFRQIRPDAKVLFMSAYNVHEVEVYGVELAPGQPFLQKPFTMDALQHTVQAALLYGSPQPRVRSGR
jgi:two-component system cell cycle sensor histidine kinase/response regulator CckA